jgi:hypothetical protein
LGESAINDGLCQVRDPGKDANLDEHLDQVFHLARKYCIIPGCTKELELLCTHTGYIPQDSYIPEEICLSECRTIPSLNDFFSVNS